MAGGIEFDWDEENRKHLAADKVPRAEFEELKNNDPLDTGYEEIDEEDRYRSAGVTNGGRLLSVIRTFRKDISQRQGTRRHRLSGGRCRH